ncbi:MAG: ferredoxin--NADP reductase [Myxococcota bacterium]|nr:ferredoxin--NADP reductase [Myxococcota bacterium]
MSSGSGPYYDLQVARIVEETHDARSIILAIPADLKATFAYRAGQFLTFGVPLDGHQWVRCYSLASCPDTEDEHKVTVKRVEDGRISNWFNDQLEAGKTPHGMKPAGHFCLQDRTAPLVFFSGGSGITPVISIIKSALATTVRRLELIYANRDENSIIFRDELEALAAEHPERLAIHHRLDEVDGFLDVPSAREFVAGQGEADFYICGPGPFMEVVEEALGAESVPDDRIFIERFVIPELESPPPGEEQELGGSTGSVEVYLDGAVHQVPCREDETILAACHRAGIDAPCACTEGYCGACMARVKQGKVEMGLNDGGLDDDQEQEGWVLTCQSRVRSAGARVDYPDAD